MSQCGQETEVPNMPREEHIQKESLLEEGCKIFMEQDSPPETVHPTLGTVPKCE